MHAKRGEKPHLGRREERWEGVGGALGGRSGGEGEESEFHVGFTFTQHKHTYTCMRGERGEEGKERKREERKRELTSEEEGERTAPAGVIGGGVGVS